MNLTWETNEDFWYRVGMVTEYLSDSGQVVCNSSCRLIVHNADGLNGMGCIFSYFWGQNVEISTFTPFTFNYIHIEVEALLLINPEQTELSNQERDGSVTGRQCVCECTFPSPSSCPNKTTSFMSNYQMVYRESRTTLLLFY